MVIFAKHNAFSMKNILTIHKFIRLKLIIFLILTLVVSCSKDPENQKIYKKAIVLYMAANNNLSGYAQDNLTAIKSGFVPDASSDQLLIIVKHLPGKDPLLVRFYKENGAVIEQTISTYVGKNSADYTTLKAALDEVHTRFKSDEYGLILWSHSTGWLPQGYYASNPAGLAPFQDPYAHLVKSRESSIAVKSFGEDRGTEMEITDLEKALNYKFSFILFDCCLSGGVETIYQLRNKADYIIASPTEILATGFPYNKIMKPLFEPDSDLVEACQEYFLYYTSNNSYATISIYKLSEIESLANICRSIFSNHRANIQNVNLLQIQPYFRLNKHWFYDIDDFAKQLATPDEYLQFSQALNRVVTHKWYTSNFLDIEIKKYSGLSTYIPKPANQFLDNFYKTLAWNQSAGMVQ